MSIKLKTKVYGTMRTVQCIDEQCPKRTCWQPHDCPIQGAGGVRNSRPRWMCLTNALKGCPDNYRERVT